MRLVNHPVLCNYYLPLSMQPVVLWKYLGKAFALCYVRNSNTNLQHLKRLGSKIIDFTGGEPLLHRQIDQLVSLAKQHKFITTLTTNGTLSKIC